MATEEGGPVLRLSGVDLDRGGVRVLTDVNWEVSTGDRWALLGPNGSGKTSMLQLASGYLHPTRGTVEVLGQRLGRTDVRALRRRVALVSASLVRAIQPSLTALQVVVAGRNGALEPWWQTYAKADWEQAEALLGTAGFASLAERPFGRLSEGERQQVLLARALMCSPALVLLDEPCAGLDMGGRERLLVRLAALARLPTTAPMVMVTHHVEEIPAGFTHALLLSGGEVRYAGPLHQVLRAEHLSACFGLALSLGHENGRWASRAADGSSVPQPGAPAQTTPQRAPKRSGATTPSDR